MNKPGEGKRFPILGIDRRDIERNPERPRNVPWKMLEPFAANAKANHDQSLQRLAERGGLSVTEMVAIIEGRNIRWVIQQPRGEDESWEKIVEYIKQFEGIAATELEWLRWFYENAATELVIENEYRLDEMKKMFEKQTGKKLPKGY